MALPINRAVDEVVLTGRMADVATTTSAWVVSPVKGRLKRVYSVIHGTVNGTAVISFAIDGATALTPTLSIADTSTAGTVDSVEFTDNYLCDVQEGSTIDIDSDGGGSTTVIGDFFLVIEKR